MVEVGKNKVKNLDGKLKSAYTEACKDPKFQRLVTKLKLKEQEAMKYTSSLQDTLEELKHCEGCKGLYECKNRLEGHVFFPKKENDRIDFVYAPCKYLKKNMEQEKENTKDEMANIGMKDIDTSDNKRVHVIKWMKKFYDNYQETKKGKGLYLHGSFGSGKTFFVTALFHELEKKGASICTIYYPELLRSLKEDWDSYAARMEYYQTVDLLLIDDIGAEKVTEWSRDEILGTILQERMNTKRTTFFTSNLNLEELESHFIVNNKSDDVIKARRILERIKQLTEDMELKAENRRK